VRRRTLLLGLVFAITTASAMPAGLVIETPGPSQLQAGNLSALPAVRYVAAYVGKPTIAYDGPLLWAVLQQAGQPPGDMRDHAGRTVAVIGADGYAAVLALAEIDPGLEGKPVMLAIAADGKGLASPRLVVPGDRAPARSVRDVVRIRLN